MIQRAKPIVYSCSGCSSAAQLANRLAIELDHGGEAQMSCIAGVGGRVDPLLHIARSGRPILALDGCVLSCARRSLEQASVVPTAHIRLDEYGVAKRKGVLYTEDDVGRLLPMIREAAAQLADAPQPREERAGRGGAGAGLRARLEAMPILQGLDAATLDLLAARARSEEFERGAYVFRRGSRPTGLYFVVSGGVKLVMLAPHGRDRTIELFTPGRMFGEIGVFRLSTYRAWTQTVRESSLIHVPQADVLTAVAQNHTLALRMLSSVSARVQSLIDSIGQKSPMQSIKRLAAYLLEQLAAQPPGTVAFTLPAPKCVIASMLNLSSESLSRAFTELRQQDIIGGRGPRLEVLDRQRLNAILDS